VASDQDVERLNAALANRYQIERDIGSGGMATVYLAQDLKHNRRVAIKVLNPDLAEALGADRFLREIEIAANLHHPHVLPLYDSGSDGGFLYYVMPYEEGQSLRERLVKESELPVQEAVRLLRDVADALAHAHEKGVVHRDIKPDNVLLSGRHALVTDFGVAKAVSEATGRQQLTTVGVALGTPAYMAPEQAAGDAHIDHRADIYAFGALAYELLTGKPPFTGPSAQAVLASHVTEAPAPVTERRASVPPALEALIMRCLEKKPADRWQTAEEMLPHLEAMATPSGGMQPTTVVAAPAAKAKRKPVWAGLAALVVVVVWAVMFWPRGTTSTVIPSAERIAILPFAPAVEDPALSELGKNLAVLLSSNLDGVGDITTVDPNILLVRGEELGRPFTLEEGIELARGFGAGSVLSGSLVRIGADVRLDAQLVSTDGQSTVARFSRVGAGEDLAALADTATWALLAEVWRDENNAPIPYLAAGMTSSFEALRAYLEGEEAFRDSRFPAAWGAYERAFTFDSTFWLAYRRYSYARGWMGMGLEPPYTAEWREHIDEFPRLEREYFEASRTRPWSARLDALRRFAERNPDFYPGWWYYGEAIFHGDISRLGEPLSETIRSFERVVELNPRTIFAWEHLLFAYIQDADLEKFMWALEELERRGGQEGVREGLGVDLVSMYRQILGWRQGEITLEEAADSMAHFLRTSRPVNPSGAGVWPWFFSLQGNAELVIEANRRLIDDPGSLNPEQLWMVQSSQVSTWASRGAWGAALGEWDRLAQTSGGEWDRLAQTFEGPPPVVLDRLFSVVGVFLGGVDPAEARSRRPEGDWNPEISAELLWTDGILGYAERDLAAVSEARRGLAAMDTTATEFMDRSLEAFELDLQGNRDQARAGLLRLEEARKDSVLGWDPLTRFAIHRVTLAQWLREAGESQRALPFLRWHRGFPMTEDVLASGVLAGALNYLEMGRVEEDLGHDALALKYYREFLRRYDMPPPQHEPLIEEAQAALERLGGG
jgi:tRNA A-37 threonylcarbamoyl transferase component Bud32/tetratricopeptide (TPR) repeat protein